MQLMHRKHQRTVRKTERLGLDITVIPQPTALDEFREMYGVTMRRVQADPFYFFPAEYWTALLTHGAGLGLVLAEGRVDGELVAASLCMSSSRWMHYHLEATSITGRAMGAAVRCNLALAQWSQSQEMSRLNLGGGLSGGSDLLLQNKQRFDPMSPLLPFHIAKLVHDRERYRELAGTDSTAGFFPPWRRRVQAHRPGV